MRTSLDGQLNYRRWDAEPEDWTYAGPFADHQEQLVQQATTVQYMTREEIQNYVQVPLIQVETFRPRRGYPKVQDRQAQVGDIVGISRSLIHPASTWYSGGPAGFTGSPRYQSNSLGLV